MTLRILLIAALTTLASLNGVPSIGQESKQASTTDFSGTDFSQVEDSIERALDWLSTEQQPDGSYPTRINGQPGVTSLCVMAFAAQGHLPNRGKHGDQLRSAVDYIIKCQKPNGLLASVAPGGKQLSRQVSHAIGNPAVYNHAFSGLALSELFSMSGGDLAAQQEAVENAIQTTLEMQAWTKPLKSDQGGWRYLNFREGKPDSDLSVTGWQVMFLRSAKNAGFQVPAESIDDAVKYIQRCFHEEYGAFTMLANKDNRQSRGMAAAGILAMAHASRHGTPEAKRSAQWLLKEGFPIYNQSRHYSSSSYTDDRYHYSVFCASQALFQMGEQYWKPFYPPLFKQIIANQRSDGSWEPDSHTWDAPYGRAYTTALMVLSLSTPNQLLPIFQR